MLNKMSSHLQLVVYSCVLAIFVYLYVYIDRAVIQSIGGGEVSQFTHGNSWFGQLLLDQAWTSRTQRLIDFIIWGLIGVIFVFVYWLFSSGKVAVHNHRVVESFVGFKFSRTSWHSHFIVLMLAKAAVLVFIVYCIIVLFNVVLPFLIESAELTVYGINQSSITASALSFIAVVATQCLIVLGVSLFQTIRVDN